MGRLTFQEVERVRAIPGHSLLLFLTDRCPVGCAHCSVDSRRDSPTISDFALFESVLDGICAQPGLTTVGISGGEPFIERRGLTLAVAQLAAAGKDIVLYTSGVWANAHVPEWIREVVRKASCVFLSTDAFHAASVDDDHFVRAAQLIAAEGVWIIVQVLKVPEMIQRVESLLQRAFGSAYSHYAEMSLILPLPYGRGASLFGRWNSRPAETFPNCDALASPVIRYDGIITACCNERVIMGPEPQRLHRRAASAKEVLAALSDFATDPLLNVMRGAGVGTLTLHPQFAELAGQEFSSICELCWAVQKRALPLGNRSDRLMNVIELLEPAIARSA